MYRVMLFAVLAAALAGCGGADNVSSPVSTPAPASAPPSAPAGSASALLQWNAVAASDLAGYRVYFGTAPGIYAQARGQGVDAGRSTSLAVGELQSGVTYYFAVTSYNSAGNESAYSSEVSKRTN